MRTILPTSTSLHDDAVISASPIVIDSGPKVLVKRFETRGNDLGTYWALCRGFCRFLEEVSLGDKFEIVNCGRLKRENPKISIASASGIDALARNQPELCAGELQNQNLEFIFSPNTQSFNVGPEDPLYSTTDFRPTIQV